MSLYYITSVFLPTLLRNIFRIRDNNFREFQWDAAIMTAGGVIFFLFFASRTGTMTKARKGPDGIYKSRVAKCHKHRPRVDYRGDPRYFFLFLFSLLFFLFYRESSPGRRRTGFFYFAISLSFRTDLPTHGRTWIRSLYQFGGIIGSRWSSIGRSNARIADKRRDSYDY